MVSFRSWSGTVTEEGDGDVGRPDGPGGGVRGVPVGTGGMEDGSDLPLSDQGSPLPLRRPYSLYYPGDRDTPDSGFKQRPSPTFIFRSGSGTGHPCPSRSWGGCGWTRSRFPLPNSLLRVRYDLPDPDQPPFRPKVEEKENPLPLFLVREVFGSVREPFPLLLFGWLTYFIPRTSSRGPSPVHNLNRPQPVLEGSRS